MPNVSPLLVVNTIWSSPHEKSVISLLMILNDERDTGYGFAAEIGRVRCPIPIDIFGKTHTLIRVAGVWWRVGVGPVGSAWI